MRWFLPPHVWAIMIAVIWAANKYAATPQIMAHTWRWWIGAPVILGGAMLAGAAVIQFKRVKAEIKPFDGPNQIVQTGVYALTRNPMYVGLTLSLLGTALIANTAWALIAPLAFVMIIDQRYIRFEEAAAQRMFGEEYLAYKAKVRRWL